MTTRGGQTLTQGRRATKSPSEGQDTREAPRNAQIALQRIRLDPTLSLSMTYLRAYADHYATTPGHKRRAKAAMHLLRMHWQHVPGR